VEGIVFLSGENTKTILPLVAVAALFKVTVVVPTVLITVPLGIPVPEFQRSTAATLIPATNPITFGTVTVTVELILHVFTTGADPD
jgi:hypothetical protein